jgi:hypothetical protein
MQGVYERITGNRMTKVDAWQVPHAPREMAGWYYSIIDDPKASYMMEKRIARNESRDLFAEQYNPKSPRSGFTVQRKKGARHILDMNFPSVIARFLQDRNRYITLTLPLRDAQKLANNDTWRIAVENYLGRDFHRMVMPWLQDIARPMSQDTTHIERIASHLRKAGTMVHIGFKLVTAAKHYTMFATTMDRIGDRSVMAKAFQTYFRSPGEAREFITARSPFMDGISKRWQRDMAEKFRNFDPNRSEFRDFLIHLSFLPIDIVIGQVADVSWLAGYSKAMKKYGWDERRAIDYADKVVRDSVGSMEAKDLSRLRRGKELQKLFTMFYAYGSSEFQRFFERAAQLRIEGTTGEETSPADKSKRFWKFLGSMVLLIGVVGMVEEMIGRRRLPTAEELARSPFDQAATALPWGNVALSTFGLSDYEPDMTPIEEVFKRGHKFFTPMWEGKFHWNKSQYENLMTGIGYAFDVPSDFMATFTEGVYNWNEPNYHPWNLFIKPPYEKKRAVRGGGDSPFADTGKSPFAGTKESPFADTGESPFAK